jgi:hypothetical protein
MVKATIVYAILLVVLGVGMYALALSGLIPWMKVSGTILIPAYMAVPFFAIGFGSMVKPSLRKHLMHLSAALSLLLVLMGLGMCFGSLAKAGFSISELERPMAPLATGLLGLLSLGYLGVCVRSFIQARKNRLSPAAA